ncbi:hypothetical protein K525DRAFT_270274 [Schizophyllum commune Loenen D]|nr:hypothetical protein K525DRAFT_270274 [Schizophyllum commune Loenen D]
MRRDVVMFRAVLARLLWALATRAVRKDLCLHFVRKMKSAMAALLRGPRSDFDITEKRGDGVFYVLVDEQVLEAYPDLCAEHPEIFKTAVSALTCNTFFNALCKVNGLWFGPTHLKGAADTLEVFSGLLDATEGIDAARAMVKELLDPFIGPAVLACESFCARHGFGTNCDIDDEAEFDLTFDLLSERIPAELSTEDFERLLPSDAPAIASTEATAKDGSDCGRKRRRAQEQEVARDTSGDGPSKSKKQKVNNAPKATGQPLLKKKDAALAARQALDKVISSYSLRNVSSQFFRDTSHVLSYGDEVDAKVGEHFLSYTISSAMQEMAPSNSLTSHGITLAHDKLTEQAFTERMAEAVGFSAHAKFNPFVCAIGRATYHVPFDQVRAHILDLYKPIIPIVLKAVEPLRPRSDDVEGRSLQARCKHIGDVIRLSAQGTRYRSGLTSLEAVLSTDKKLVAAMFDRELLRDLGIL